MRQNRLSIKVEGHTFGKSRAAEVLAKVVNEHIVNGDKVGVALGRRAFSIITDYIIMTHDLESVNKRTKAGLLTAYFKLYIEPKLTTIEEKGYKSIRTHTQNIIKTYYRKACGFPIPKGVTTV